MILPVLGATAATNDVNVMSDMHGIGYLKA